MAKAAVVVAYLGYLHYYYVLPLPYFPTKAEVVAVALNITNLRQKLCLLIVSQLPLSTALVGMDPSPPNQVPPAPFQSNIGLSVNYGSSVTTDVSVLPSQHIYPGGNAGHLLSSVPQQQGSSPNDPTNQSAILGPEVPMEALALRAQLLCRQLPQFHNPILSPFHNVPLVSSQLPPQNAFVNMFHTGQPTRTSPLRAPAITPLSDRTNESSNGQSTKRQKRDMTPDRMRDMKSLALNYFCDIQGRSMKKLCSDKQKSDLYENLNKFINSDVLLKELHSEMKKGRIENRSNAIRRINELIPDQVDCSSFVKPIATTSCSGMNNPQVASYGEANPGDCLNYWSYSHNAWRAKKCQVNTHLDGETAVLFGWRQISIDGDVAYQCSSCVHAKNNASQRHSDRFNSSSRLDAITKMLKNQVREKYNAIIDGGIDHDACTHKFKQDLEVIQSMKMLVARGIHDVKCDGGNTLVRICGTNSCDEIMVVRVQSNNAHLCQQCTRKKESEERSELRREQNYYKQVAHDSKTNHKFLTEEQKIDRIKNLQEEKVHRGQKANLLDAKLKKKVDFDKERKDASKDFLDAAEFMLDELLSDEAKLRENLTVLMTKISGRLLEKDHNKKKGKKVSVEETGEMVDLVVETMLNTSMSLNGKKRQCEVSSLILQIAQAVWSTSNSAFKELVTLCPIPWPSISTLQRRKKEAHVSDGRNEKHYQQRKAERNASGRSNETGHLQVDEMCLKHGVVWNTNTGEAIGLANDVVDMETMMTRLLSEEGDVVEPAKYVNQWQYVSFGQDGLEIWTCEHFFNNGSLTGKTLARQYDIVVKNCESIQAEVNGVVLDAGGNNSKFVSMVLELRRLGHDISWLNDEDCYAKNICDTSRRVYFWFCTTHLYKALRNGLLGSSSKGKKAFKDKYGTAFGWKFVEKLHDLVQTKKATSHSKVSCNVRLCDKAVNPKNQLRMSVPLVKMVFEHKTVAFGIAQKSDEMGISAQELDQNTAECRSMHPHHRTDSENKHRSDLRHCHNLEKALYLQKVAKEQAGAPMSANLETPELATGSAMNDDDDDSVNSIEEDFLDEMLEKIEEVCERVEAEAKEVDQTEELQSDLASLVFMGVIESLFNNVLMNKFERLTADNIDIYEKMVKGLLRYFLDWKIAQLERKRMGDKDWTKTFLAHQTYKNLRVSVSGFFHYARYMLTVVFPKKEGLSYMSMLCSNQPPLKGKFSAQRRTGHDRADTYSTGISIKKDKQVMAALKNGKDAKSYSSEDCVEVATNHGTQKVGSSLFRKHLKEADAELGKLLAVHKKICDDNSCEDTLMPSRFGMHELGVDDEVLELCEYEQMEDLAAEMNYHYLHEHFIDLIINSKSFQGSFKLCYDQEDMKSWFYSFVACDNAEMTRACHSLCRRLFGFLEKEIFGEKSLSFEMAIRKFCLSDEFDDFYCASLPATINENRLGALYILDSIQNEFENWVYTAVTTIAEHMKNTVEEEVKISDEGVKAMMHRMVGAGVPKTLTKLCPLERDDDPTYILLRNVAFQHADAILNKDYMHEWYPSELQHENKGKLHLIQPAFLEWSTKLILFSINHFSKRNLILYRSECIMIGLDELKADESIYEEFKKAALTISELSVDVLSEDQLKRAHLGLITFAFHAYSGFRWQSEFNSIKQSSKDKSNLAMRALMQTTGSADGSTTSKSAPKGSKSTAKAKPKKRSVCSMLTNKPEVATDPGTIAAAAAIAAATSITHCGTEIPATDAASTAATNCVAEIPATDTASSVQKSNKRQRRSKNQTEEELKAEYEGKLNLALTTFKHRGSCVDKISKELCCVLLWACYERLYIWKSSSVKTNGENGVKAELRAKIAANPSRLQVSLPKNREVDSMEVDEA